MNANTPLILAWDTTPQTAQIIANKCARTVEISGRVGDKPAPRRQFVPEAMTGRPTPSAKTMAGPSGSDATAGKPVVASAMLTHNQITARLLKDRVRCERSRLRKRGMLPGGKKIVHTHWQEWLNVASRVLRSTPDAIAEKFGGVEGLKLGSYENRKDFCAWANATHPQIKI